MELWIAAVLFVAMLTGCIICSVAAYNKNKKFMALAVLLGVIGIKKMKSAAK